MHSTDDQYRGYTELEAWKSRTYDQLRYVSQCARAVLMSGCTCPGREQLAKSLEQLERLYEEQP